MLGNQPQVHTHSLTNSSRPQGLTHPSSKALRLPTGRKNGNGSKLLTSQSRWLAKKRDGRMNITKSSRRNVNTIKSQIAIDFLAHEWGCQTFHQMTPPPTSQISGLMTSISFFGSIFNQEMNNVKGISMHLEV